MNAHKFVEQYGLEEARKLIAFAGPFYLKSFIVKNNEIDADELKQAIADFELVEKDFETLEMAEYEYMVSASYDEPYWIQVKQAATRIKEGLRDE